MSEQVKGAPKAVFVTPDAKGAKKKRANDEEQIARAVDERNPNSQDEDEVQSVDEGDQLMGFGKYYDQSFREAYSQDLGYYEWARKQDTPCSQMQRFIDWVGEQERASKRARRNEGETFTFGKHTGETFRHVAENEPGYVAWARSLEHPNNPQLQAFVDWVDQNGLSLYEAPYENEHGYEPMGAWTDRHIANNQRKYPQGYCWDWLQFGFCSGCTFRHEYPPQWTEDQIARHMDLQDEDFSSFD